MEELCFDYGDNNEKINYNLNIESEDKRKLCYCGTINCRKYLPNLCY